jgi:uncharacterized integral membrane protein
MQILLTVAATVVLVLFGVQNSDHVTVSLIVGRPTQIRLIFLLLIAACTGFLFSYIRGLSREIQLKKEIRRLACLHDQQTALAAAEDEV